MGEYVIKGQVGPGRERTVKVVAANVLEGLYIVLQARGHGFRITSITEIPPTPVPGDDR